MDSNYQLILQQAASLYHVDTVSENAIGNSANKIFEVKLGNTPYILRASDYSDRKKAHVDFELHWMDYLAGSMGSIVRLQKSKNNRLYEVIHGHDQSYILCLFEKAEGKAVNSNDPEEFHDALFFKLGALMGDMQRLTKDYPGNKILEDFQWYNSTFSWPEYNVVLDPDVQPYEKRYHSEICKLPIFRDSYGIIHHDVHTENFFVHEGNIRLFDFDDCEFNWYAADLADTLFFLVQTAAGPAMNQNEKQRTDFAETCLASFLKGYTQTNSIRAFWIHQLDLFMRYRMTLGYKFVQNNWRDEPIHPYQWYLDWHKNRIVNNLPYVFVDYKKVISGIPGIVRE